MPAKRAERWPLYEERGVRALDLLGEVVLLAAKRGAGNFDLLAGLVLRCAANAHGHLNDHGHIELVRQARDHAVLGQWTLVERLLNHRGG